MPDYLDIKNERICDCPPKHINCMEAKEWVAAQLGVWQFYYESRDVRDKKLHPATFPISLAKKCISLFTHRGELVLDPFSGSGTTLLAAQDLDRNAIGFDLKADYINLADGRLRQSTGNVNTKQITCWDDARRIAEYLNSSSVSLVVTSPPYANLLNRPRLNKSRRGDTRVNEQYLKVEQYSQDHRDLGILELKEFELAIEEIFAGLYPLIKEKGHCVVNVPDIWSENRRITLHMIMVETLRSVGYELRNTIIWDRTNIVNRVGIFGWPSNYITMGTTFEYIL